MNTQREGVLGPPWSLSATLLYLLPRLLLPPQVLWSKAHPSSKLKFRCVLTPPGRPPWLLLAPSIGLLFCTLPPLQSSYSELFNCHHWLARLSLSLEPSSLIIFIPGIWCMLDDQEIFITNQMDELSDLPWVLSLFRNLISIPGFIPPH